MNKQEEEEEDEDKVFLPDQDFYQNVIDTSKQMIEKLEQEATRLEAIVSQKQRHVASLQTQQRLMDGSTKGYILYIEQMRARKQPWWWFVLVIFSFVCFLGQWDKGSKLLALLNLFGHKLLWRRMYVDINTPGQLLAMIIIAYTLAFG